MKKRIFSFAMAVLLVLSLNPLTANATAPQDDIIHSNARDGSTIAMGISHALAISSEGYLWTWGPNFYGQLGRAGQGLQQL